MIDFRNDSNFRLLINDFDCEILSIVIGILFTLI